MYNYYSNYYYSDGTPYYTMGTLQLEATTDSVSWTTIWTKSDDKVTAGRGECERRGQT